MVVKQFDWNTRVATTTMFPRHKVTFARREETWPFKSNPLLSLSSKLTSDWTSSQVGCWMPSGISSERKCGGRKNWPHHRYALNSHLRIISFAVGPAHFLRAPIYRVRRGISETRLSAASQHGTSLAATPASAACPTIAALRDTTHALLRRRRRRR